MKRAGALLLALLLCLLSAGCRFADLLPPTVSEPETSSQPLLSGEAHETRDYITLFSSYEVPKPWYESHLTDKQKDAEDKIYRYLCSFSSGTLQFSDLSEKDLSIAQYAVRHDHPALFWIPASFYTETVGTTRGIRFSDQDTEGYSVTPEQASQMVAEQDAAVRDFLASLPDCASDYEIELAAHDRIVSLASYDEEAAEDYSNNPLAFTAYGALVQHKAVCEGYAKAFQLLLNAAGIECMTVTGDNDGGHMWNMVRLGDEWYHVDLTADDDIGGLHLFFNRTDSFMQQSDYRINGDYESKTQSGQHYNLFRPKAESDRMLYHRVSGFFCTADSRPEELGAVIAACCPEGSGTVEICLDDSVGLYLFDLRAFMKEVDYSDLKVGAVQIRQVGNFQRYPILVFQS